MADQGQPSTPQPRVALFCAQSDDTRARIGESIPPAATPILKKLGLFHLFDNTQDHLVCPGSISLWNSEEAGHNDFFLDPVGVGYHLDRAKFDRHLLCDAEARGANVHKNWRLMRLAEKAPGYALTFSVDGARQKTIFADYVIDASGKSAAFARRLNVARNTLDELLFLCYSFVLGAADSMQPQSYIEAVSDGWWYAAALPGKRAIVTFCTDKQSMRAGTYQQAEQWLAALRASKAISRAVPLKTIAQTITSEAIITSGAPSSILSAVIGERWLAVGDAASCYDPISSAGITKALMQGETAGKAVAALMTRGSDGELKDYQTGIFNDFTAFARMRAMHYEHEKRFKDAPFWRRRLGY